MVSRALAAKRAEPLFAAQKRIFFDPALAQVRVVRAARQRAFFLPLALAPGG
jgi:hypothetical protein